MGNGLAIPVLLGLGIGIAFVALFASFAIYHGSSDTVTSTTKSGISITLEGLKYQYSIDEPLNFTVAAKGRGALCGDPTATILKAKSGEVAYDFPNIDVIYECLPDPVDHDITWTLKDMMDPYSPILIGQPGRYTLEVELAGVVLQKDFVIYDDENTGIPVRYQHPPDGKKITGNLTVYLLPVSMQEHESEDVIGIVLDVIGYVDAGHYSDYGASPRGQYTDEGETQKPTETVKFYIDSEIKKPDGSPITRTDLIEYYSFGNGIACCGFTLKDGTDVIALIIVVDWAYDEYMVEKMDELKNALGAGEGTTVKVVVVDKPREGMVQTGMDTSLTTRYLPVNITQTVNLTQPTRNITIYPVLADWDGIVRPDDAMKSPMYDENNNPVPFTGFANISSHGVNATCTEPYFVKVNDADLGEDGIMLENSTRPVSSIIYWGDTLEGSFGEPQSGAIYYTRVGYGIVPEDYNNNNDKTYRNNGAGNQELSGTYHLSFSSFYRSTVNLPERAALTSFLEVTCTINQDSPHVQKSEFPNIYIYDLWFRIDSSSVVSSDQEGWQTEYVVGRFLNADPPKEDKIFKFQYKVTNGTVEDFKIVRAFNGDVLSQGIDIRVSSSNTINNAVLEIMIPRNFAYTNNPPETPSSIDDDFAFLLPRGGGTMDTRNTTECFFVFSVPVTDSIEMTLGMYSILTRSPYHGDAIPDSCIPQTLVENVPTRNDGRITPLQQFRAGVAAEDAVCPTRQLGDDQLMLLISPNQKPYCVKRSDEGFMKRHGWIEPLLK